MKIETNKVYCMDAFELLKQLPDNSVDLVLTDPPYELTKEEWDKDVFNEEIIKMLYRILKDNGSIYVWCGIGKKSNSLIKWFPILSKYFIFQNLITWRKQRGYGVKNNWMFVREEVMFFTKSNDYTFNVQYTDILRQKYGFKNKDGNLSSIYNKSDCLRASNVWIDINEAGFDGSHNFYKELGGKHPTPKPVKCIERLIIASSNKGDLIVDCFVGSGTTAVACKKLNRNFICCDNNADYVAITNKRLAQQSVTDFTQNSTSFGFPTENSPNISLKESSSEDSQISSNDETSLNNNIKSNSEFCSQRGK